MSHQAVDKYGAADFLGISLATVAYRMKNQTFPKPDAHEKDTDWWELTTLDKYQKALKRKASNRKKTNAKRVDARPTKSGDTNQRRRSQTPR